MDWGILDEYKAAFFELIRDDVLLDILNKQKAMLERELIEGDITSDRQYVIWANSVKEKIVYVENWIEWVELQKKNLGLTDQNSLPVDDEVEHVEVVDAE